MLKSVDKQSRIARLVRAGAARLKRKEAVHVAYQQASREVVQVYTRSNPFVALDGPIRLRPTVSIEAMVNVMFRRNLWPLVQATINGQRIKRESWHEVIPNAGTTVILQVIPQGSIVSFAVTLAAVAIDTFIFGNGSSFGTGLSDPSFQFGELGFQLGGSNNRLQPNDVIPVLLGSMKFRPVKALVEFTEERGHCQYLNTCFLLGWGQLDIDGADITVSDVPIRDYEENVVYEIIEGIDGAERMFSITPGSTYKDVFPDIDPQPTPWYSGADRDTSLWVEGAPPASGYELYWDNGGMIVNTTVSPTDDVEDVATDLTGLQTATNALQTAFTNLIGEGISGSFWQSVGMVALISILGVAMNALAELFGVSMPDVEDDIEDIEDSIDDVIAGLLAGDENNLPTYVGEVAAGLGTLKSRVDLIAANVKTYAGKIGYQKNLTAFAATFRSISYNLETAAKNSKIVSIKLGEKGATYTEIATAMSGVNTAMLSLTDSNRKVSDDLEEVGGTWQAVSTTEYCNEITAEIAFPNGLLQSTITDNVRQPTESYSVLVQLEWRRKGLWDPTSEVGWHRVYPLETHLSEHGVSHPNQAAWHFTDINEVGPLPGGEASFSIKNAITSVLSVTQKRVLGIVAGSQDCGTTDQWGNFVAPENVGDILVGPEYLVLPNTPVRTIVSIYDLTPDMTLITDPYTFDPDTGHITLDSGERWGSNIRSSNNHYSARYRVSYRYERIEDVYTEVDSDGYTVTAATGTITRNKGTALDVLNVTSADGQDAEYIAPGLTGATTILITCDGDHGLATGAVVNITSVAGVANANKRCSIIRVNDTQFTLALDLDANSAPAYVTGTDSYTGGGSIDINYWSEGWYYIRYQGTADLHDDVVAYIDDLGTYVAGALSTALAGLGAADKKWPFTASEATLGKKNFEHWLDTMQDMLDKIAGLEGNWTGTGGNVWPATTIAAYQTMLDTVGETFLYECEDGEYPPLTTAGFLDNFYNSVAALAELVRIGDYLSSGYSEDLNRSPILHRWLVLAWATARDVYGDPFQRRPADSFQLTGQAIDERFGLWFPTDALGHYEVRVRRSQAPASNKDDIREQGFFTALNTGDLTQHPVQLGRMAQLEMRFRGSEDFQGSIGSIDVTATSMARVWDGVDSAQAYADWDLTATNNPAWLYLKVLMDSGHNLNPATTAQVELQRFKDWADACDDQKNVPEDLPAITFNAYVTQATTVMKMLGIIARCGGAIPTTRLGEFSVIEDLTARTAPHQFFGPNNSHSFSIQRTYHKSQPNAVDVSYVDADTGNIETLRVFDDDYNDDGYLEFTEDLTADGDELTVTNLPLNSVVYVMDTNPVPDEIVSSADYSFDSVTGVITHTVGSWGIGTERWSVKYKQTQTVPDEVFTLDILGVTDSYNAYRNGRRALAEALLRIEEVSLITDIEALVIEPGQMAHVSSPIPLWGLSQGEIKALETNGASAITHLILENNAVMEVGTNYVIRVRGFKDDAGDGLIQDHLLPVDTDDRAAKTITNATNATPIVITTSAAHGYTTEDHVDIVSVEGNTAANGDDQTITVVDATHFSLDDSVGNAAYVSGGQSRTVSNMVRLTTPLASATGNPAVGDLYFFGVEDLESEEMLLRDVEPKENSGAQLTFVHHAPAVYTAHSGPIPEFQANTTIPPELVKPLPPKPVVAGVNSGESAASYRDSFGKWKERIIVSLTRFSVTAAQVYPDWIRAQIRPSLISVQGGESTVSTAPGRWIAAAAPYPATTLQVIYGEVTTGQKYDLRFRYVTDSGLAGNWAYVYGHEVIGFSEPPPDITDLRLAGNNLIWEYDKPPDFDQFLLRVYYGDDTEPLWEQGLNIVGSGKLTECVFNVESWRISTPTFLLKAQDSLGNVSENYALLVADIGDPVVENVILEIDHHDDGFVGDSIWTGDGNLIWNATVTPLNISGATNAEPIVITTAAHNFSTGDKVATQDVLGNTAANGTWPITVLNATTFELDDSHGNGTYTSGGTVDLLIWQPSSGGIVSGSVDGSGDLVGADLDDYMPIWSGTPLTLIWTDDAALIWGSNWGQVRYECNLDPPTGSDGSALTIAWTFEGGQGVVFYQEALGTAAFGPSSLWPGTINVKEDRRYKFTFIVGYPESEPYAEQPKITALVLRLDVPDVVERVGPVTITVAVSGARVPLTKAFNSVEYLTLTLHESGTDAVGLRWDKDTSPLPDGPLVYAYDAAGNKTTGTFSALVKGY